jgi:hypothetical protein
LAGVILLAAVAAFEMGEGGVGFGHK